MTKTQNPWHVDLWCRFSKQDINIRVDTGTYLLTNGDNEKVYTIMFENPDTYQELELELSASQARELVKRIIAAPLESFGDRFGRWVFRQTVKKRVLHD